MRIPEGWLDYCNISKPIENVPIIAFKTPLSEQYNRPEGCTSDGIFVEKDKEFTPSQLVKKVEDAGFELLVVIDLTFTFRYYNGQVELEDEFGVQYDKVKCAGQMVPDDQVVLRVANILNDVLLEHGTESKKLVGIHCTHGVNRTGYVISRYLIEWLNYEPEKAIEAVGKARGHPIEREPYLEDLKKRKPNNGFELWKNKQNFATDDTYNQGEFITHNSYPRHSAAPSDDDKLVDRRMSGRNWTSYNNDSYYNYRSHDNHRNNYNERYTPYDHRHSRRRRGNHQNYDRNRQTWRSRDNRQGDNSNSNIDDDKRTIRKTNNQSPPRW